jgi:hypothetical protein
MLVARQPIKKTSQAYEQKSDNDRYAYKHRRVDLQIDGQKNKQTEIHSEGLAGRLAIWQAGRLAESHKFWMAFSLTL